MPAEFRYEIKYLASEETLQILQHKLLKIMRSDSHANVDGIYCIRSLYYDDDKDTGYYENLNGVDPRSKYRLRFYVGNSNFVRLERKEKNRSMTKKTSCVLTEEQITSLLKENRLNYTGDMPPLLKAFYLDLMTKGLKPKTIVEYDRTPFIYNTGNVRITFDRNIRASDEIGSFMNDDISFRLVMPQGMHVLEVKYDHFLPDFIRQTAFTSEVILTDYSKYCMCRKFSMNANKLI